jgi:hypothetical protein
VPVIYSASDLDNSYIYTFGGFYMTGILWMMVPMMLWTAFSLSFLDRTDKVVVSFRGIRVERLSDKIKEKMEKSSPVMDIPDDHHLL